MREDGKTRTEFTETIQNDPLQKRFLPLPIDELLTLRAEVLSDTSKPAHSWPNLPSEKFTMASATLSRMLSW
jgi:hypothetical protein